MRRTTDYLVKVGQAIATARKQKGFTQDGLSEKLTIKANALSRIETGQKNFHIMTLKSIADALGKDIKDFL
jgi:transcriptional regulator with XRE-family HTH domain